MRRYGTAPEPGVVYRDRPGVYCIVREGDQIMVVEQDGEVMLPGGGIERGENPVQALHREVYEETGWTVAAERRLGVFARYCWLEPYNYWCRKIEHIYLCRPIRRLGPPLETDHTPVFVDTPDALAMLAAEGERVMLAQVMRSGASPGRPLPRSRNIAARSRKRLP